MSRAFTDLSMPIASDMPTNAPDHFPPEITPYATVAKDGWQGSELHLDSHCGTHVDAPLHFVQGAAGLDEVPLETLMGPATVIQIGESNGAGIQATEIPGGLHERVLFATGDDAWAHSDPDRYFKRNSYLSEAGARALVAANVKLVGIDSPSVDPPGIDSAHQILLAAEITVVENLCHLTTLPAEVGFAVLPLRIIGGDGSPARAVATYDATL